jgi:hypothetical protein
MRRYLWLGVGLLLVGCGGSGLALPQATATNPPIPTIGVPTAPRPPTATLPIPFPATVTPAILSRSVVTVAATPTHAALPTVPPTARVATAAPVVPDATLTDAQYATDYPRIDPRALDKTPDAFKGARLTIEGEAIDVGEKDGNTGISLSVPIPGSAYDSIYVQIGITGTYPTLYKGAHVIVYGVGAGSMTGKNAFGGTVTNAVVRGVSIRYTT